MSEQPSPQSVLIAATSISVVWVFLAVYGLVVNVLAPIGFETPSWQLLGTVIPIVGLGGVYGLKRPIASLLVSGVFTVLYLIWFELPIWLFTIVALTVFAGVALSHLELTRPSHEVLRFVRRHYAVVAIVAWLLAYAIWLVTVYSTMKTCLFC